MQSNKNNKQHKCKTHNCWFVYTGVCLLFWCLTISKPLLCFQPNSIHIQQPHHLHLGILFFSINLWNKYQIFAPAPSKEFWIRLKMTAFVLVIKTNIISVSASLSTTPHGASLQSHLFDYQRLPAAKQAWRFRLDSELNKWKCQLYSFSH